jgi:shikimate kinase
VLIGLPGCGKTTVGRLLAERSGRPFIDIGRLMEERAGCTCGDYLRIQREEAFRRLEAEALREAGMRTGCVIAAGGMLTEPENRDILRQNGIIFHLDRPPEALSQSGGRPLSASPEMRMALRKTQAASYAAMRDYSVRNEDAETAAREIERLLEIHWEESR